MKESPLSSIFLKFFPNHSIVSKYNHIIINVSSTLIEKFLKILMQKIGHIEYSIN